MKIGPEHIETNQFAGYTAQGSPIIYVLTKGGLHVFFTRGSDNGVTALGAAPHKAIAEWLVEQKEPGVKWNDSFKPAEIAKSENAQSLKKHERLRKIMFSPACDRPMQSEDRYLLYSKGSKFEVVTHDQLAARLRKGEDTFSFVRHMSFTDEAQLACVHPAFRGINAA